MLIDTGADATILDEALAEQLAMDLKGVAPVAVRGYGGRTYGRPAVLDLVPLSQDELRVRVDVVFVPGVADEIGNVLGLDYFAYVDLSLSHANSFVSLYLPA